MEPRQVKSGQARGSPTPAVIAVPCAESLVSGPVSRDPPGTGLGSKPRDTRRAIEA